MLDAAIALGGTVTGEHGVGLLKRDGMRRELDPGSLALQDAVRRALDPRGDLQPRQGLELAAWRQCAVSRFPARNDSAVSVTAASHFAFWLAG